MKLPSISQAVADARDTFVRFPLIILDAVVGTVCALIVIDHELGYWNYCKTLCLRILTAGLYTAVLWGGLAIALAALDNLFGVDIPEKRYGE